MTHTEDYDETRAAAASVTQEYKRTLKNLGTLKGQTMTDKIDTTPEAVEQAVGELTDLTRCRCHEAYTSRNLGRVDCDCDSVDAVKALSTRIAELEAKLAKAGGALEFYNEVLTAFSSATDETADVADETLDRDGGKLARAALTEIKGDNT